MLKEMRIRNFKGWEDTEPLRLAPITVFFGANSSGKSSLQQFLLMLKQTAASPDRTRALHFGDSNTPVDLGGYQDAVYSHDLERSIGFELKWAQEMRLDVSSDAEISGDSVALEATISRREGRKEQLRVGSLNYRVLAGDREILQAGMRVHPQRPSRFALEFENFDPIRTRGRAWELPSPSRFYGFPDEAVAYFQNTDFLPDLPLALERVLSGISYLGPLRERAQRIYTWTGGTPEHVGWRGEKTVEALLAGSDRQYNLGYRQRLRPLQVVVAQQLTELGLIDSFTVDAIARNRPEHEVRVRVSRAADEELLTDVGFGVSQVLPVVVQAFYAAPNTTVLMEQPELHLHPSVQMRLADFFISAIHAREAGEPRNVQFILESHSEHFLRRLQRRVADGRLSADEVALYFCEIKGRGDSVKPLDVDLFGNILNWPDGFFGDPMEDVAGQAEAQLKRQLAGESDGSTS